MTGPSVLAPLNPVVAALAGFWFNLPLDWEEEATVTTPVGLLVGEQPGPGSNPKLPLWPYPPRGSGARLQRMSGIPMGVYLTRLARVNLMPKPVARWNPHEARRNLTELLAGLPAGTRVVLCGARVRDAAGIPAWFTEWPLIHPAGGYVHPVAIPHPSGRNRDYDTPTNVELVREALRWAAHLDNEPETEPHP